MPCMIVLDFIAPATALGISVLTSAVLPSYTEMATGIDPSASCSIPIFMPGSNQDGAGPASVAIDAVPTGTR